MSMVASVTNLDTGQGDSRRGPMAFPRTQASTELSNAYGR